MKLIVITQQKAAMINIRCENATEELLHSYATDRFNSSLFKASSRISNSHSIAPFSNIKTAGAGLWYSLSRKRQSFEAFKSSDTSIHFYNIGSKSSHLHHSLIWLLLANDKELVTYINEGQLALEGEIGNLIIQRLKDILYSQKTIQESPDELEKKRKTASIIDPTLAKNSADGLSDDLRLIKKRISQLEIKGKAASIINHTLANNSADGLFKCHFPTLQSEITKLILHAELHPQHKKIWLGTARSVNAIIQDKNEFGTYLNCDDTKWTWLLNRLWLQAAINLGYSIELVEQQYPKMEHALMAQDGGALFVQELLNQVRSKPELTSQYTGSDAPTATSQEILVLLDMGCNISKGSNHRISFSRALARDTASNLFSSSARYRSSNPCSHSWDGGHFTSQPPLKSSPVQFFSPEQSSENIRLNHQFESLSINAPNATIHSPTTLYKPTAMIPPLTTKP